MQLRFLQQKKNGHTFVQLTRRLHRYPRSSHNQKIHHFNFLQKNATKSSKQYQLETGMKKVQHRDIHNTTKLKYQCKHCGKMYMLKTAATKHTLSCALPHGGLINPKDWAYKEIRVLLNFQVFHKQRPRTKDMLLFYMSNVQAAAGSIEEAIEVVFTTQPLHFTLAMLDDTR